MHRSKAGAEPATPNTRTTSLVFRHVPFVSGGVLNEEPPPPYASQATPAPRAEQEIALAIQRCRSLTESLQGRLDASILFMRTELHKLEHELRELSRLLSDSPSWRSQLEGLKAQLESLSSRVTPSKVTPLLNTSDDSSDDEWDKVWAEHPAFTRPVGSEYRSEYRRESAACCILS